MMMESSSGSPEDLSLQPPPSKAKKKTSAAGDTTADAPASQTLLPPCRVCGGKASGFHYGANTCEACKGFFRRSLKRKTPYRCMANGKCQIMGRRKNNTCARCRWNRCLSIGMSKEAIKTGRYTHEKKTRDIIEIKAIEEGRLLPGGELVDQTAVSSTTVAEECSSPAEERKFPTSAARSFPSESERNFSTHSDRSVSSHHSNQHLPSHSAEQNLQSSMDTNFPSPQERNFPYKVETYSPASSYHSSPGQGFKSPHPPASHTDVSIKEEVYDSGYSPGMGPYNSPESIDEPVLSDYEKQLLEMVDRMTATYEKTTYFTQEVLARMPEREKQFLEEQEMQRKMFGPMQPLPKQEYMKIYQDTGLDIDGRKAMMQRLIARVEDSTKKLIAFAKSIPGFKTLSVEDQIALLKCGKVDTHFILTYRRYNVEHRIVHSPSSRIYNLMELTKIDSEELWLMRFSIAGLIYKLGVSREEMVMMAAVCFLMTDRCQLDDKQTVEGILQTCVDALMLLFRRNHPDKPHLFASVAAVLTELRNLADKDLVIENLEQVADMQLPPLYLELFQEGKQ